MRTARELSARWLTDRGADAELLRAVTEDVGDRLAALPSALRLAAGTLDRALGVLPGRARQWILARQGIGEYAHLIEGLTAVSYFDTAATSARIPAPRPAPTAQRATAPR